MAPGASAKNFPRARVGGPVQLATHDSEPLYDTRPVTVKRYAMFDKILQTLSICSVLAVVVLATGAACAQELTDRDVAALSKLATTGTGEQKDVAVQMLLDRGKTDIVPSLIFAMRYRRDNQVIPNALKTLTGAEITGWQTGMLWQEAHPELKPHPSYRQLKLDMYERIDPKFLNFLGGDLSLPENLGIRFEEIAWGGVRVDDLPPLDNPKMLTAKEADYLLPDDLVFGVEINGDARAYPLRIMGWHEMFNETIGGVPVALAYCTLCGAGILFETKVEGRDEPFVLASSGFLYRSNKLMFDRQTNSLWNQFTGQPVSGPLFRSGIALKIRPVVITSWAKWKTLHPHTTALSLYTGHDRDYDSGVVYRQYFNSPDLMFPAIVRNEEHLKRKDYVFGIRDVGAARAWPVTAFEKQPVINDAVGQRKIVLVGDPKTRTVRAYDRKDREFGAGDRFGMLTGPGGTWRATEEALLGPKGESLPRVPGHISYWFAWDGYLGVESTLYLNE